MWMHVRARGYVTECAYMCVCTPAHTHIYTHIVVQHTLILHYYVLQYRQ